MSDPHLPAEILDYIVDHLHDAKDTLRNCGIVSKSWVPRTRNHLFADIDFRTVEVLESWKKSFPDPSTSPARYTRTLSVGRPDVITAADAEAGGWITGFSRVVHLEVDDHKHFFSESEVSLVPLHGLSPIVKSLRIFTPSLRFLYVFNLILSFPLLEDLDVTVGMPEKEDSDGTEEVQRPTAVQLSSPPRFTGTLELCLGGKIGPVARRLLSLPSGIHFRKITLVWLHKDDLPTITAFVEKCSHSLESLDIAWNVVYEPGSTSFSLSKATKLKDVMFRLDRWSIQFVITALQTISSEHRDLRQIAIHIPYDSPITGADVNIRQAIGETDYGQWLNLDRLLVRLWETYSIRPEVAVPTERVEGTEGMRDCVGHLLPEITNRGIIDLAEYEYIPPDDW